MTVASSVLIADDDEDIRTLVSTILTKAGFHAEAVDGGVPALAAAEREQQPQIYATSGRPVLLISAESSSADVAAAFAAGCDDYLPKPFSPRELVHRVDQLLARTA